MRRFTEKDFPEIALAAFFVQASRNPGASTIELARQGAEMAEQIIREENMEPIKLEIELPRRLAELLEILESAIDPTLTPNRVATISIAQYLMASPLAIPEKKEAAEIFLDTTLGRDEA